MNVIFKLPEQMQHLEKDYFFDLNRLPPATKKILTEIRDFVIQRLRVLKEEIEREDKKSTNKSGVVIDFSNNTMKIQYVNYSEDLTNKMKGCFSEEDFEYLLSIIR